MPAEYETRVDGLTCPVHVFRPQAHRCGEPIERFGLCAKHAADKVRLGGAS